MPDFNFLDNLACQVRRDILRMVHKVNSGHPGGSLGCTEFFIALYYEIMKLKDGFDMDGHEEDLFFLTLVKLMDFLFVKSCAISFNSSFSLLDCNSSNDAFKVISGSSGLYCGF